MRRAALLAILSHWRRRPMQLAILIAGLSMATALWSGVQAINAEARAGYDRAADLAYLTALPTIVSDDGLPPTLDDFAALRRAGIPVSPILSGPLPKEAARGVTLYGIDPLSHPVARTVSASSASSGSVLQLWNTEEPVLFADTKTAENLRALADFPKIVVSQQLAPGQLLGDIGLVADLLGQPGGLSSIGLVEAPTTDLPDGYRIVDAPRSADVRGLTDSFHLNLTAFGALSFAVGLFILHSGIGLAIEQRRAMIRTIRATGVPLKTVVWLLGAELLVIALISGTIGIALGYGVAAALLPNVSATLSGLYGAEGVGTLSLRPSWIFAGMGLAVIGTAVAGAGALRKIAVMPLLVPAMPRAWTRGSRRSSIALALVGVACWVIALIGVVYQGGLIMAFVTLAALLVGAAFVLPIAMHFALGLGGHLARRPIARWFWADSQSQLSGLNLSLMALLLALSANIGVNTMVSSFRAAFVGFLDQRLVADLYVTARTDAESEVILEWLADKPVAILPIWHNDTTLFDRPAEIYGVVDDPIYRERWPMIERLPDAWDRLHAGQGAMISEQLARRGGLSLGNTIQLSEDWAFPIVGIYADYGNPGGQAAVSNEILLARYPDVDRFRLGLRVIAGKPDELRSALLRDLGLPQNIVTDRVTVRDFSLRIFERTFAVTGALNVLTLGVAGFAILTSLLTLSAMRLPGLAPVWAVGVTRKTLALIEFGRGVVLAAFTFALALPVGLALAWVLLTIVNAEAFGWQLPMALFPAGWAQMFGLALLAGGISSLWPAIRLARIAPAKLQQVFAHER